MEQPFSTKQPSLAVWNAAFLPKFQLDADDKRIFRLGKLLRGVSNALGDCVVLMCNRLVH